MTPSNVFSIVNMLAMIMWLFMIISPTWKGTRFLVDTKLVPLVLSLVYIVYIIQAMGISGGMDFGSLDSVMALFTEEHAVLAGWVHYLAFDLLVGMWILDQNRTMGLNHFIIIPCLIAAFMLGPIGFLVFMCIKTLRKTS